MNKVEKKENVNNVCRLCLSSDSPKSSIFGGQDSSISLVTKIQLFLSIKVSVNDKLSTLICVNCIKHINKWNDYRESCLRSQDKLNEWLSKQADASPEVITIKTEPVDSVEILLENINNIEEIVPDVTLDHEVNVVDKDCTVEFNHNEETQNKETVERPEIEENELTKDSDKDTHSLDKDLPQLDKEICNVAIKDEPQDSCDTDCIIEIESVTGNELLMNNVEESVDDVVMEADSTQKSNATVKYSLRKKTRRGPHTHYRGTKIFIQKCTICKINLHSKHSYENHMNKFHNPSTVTEVNNIQDESIEQEEEVEDIEDELVSMEKDSPLTQVQQNIISQLKTFSCYACKQSFNDRRSTLNHIRQHMPDLRPYTCIACLTEFPDRSMYKLHCGASFECAMKIALVVPKHGNEKYFTCNMCLKPLPNRKDLLSHLFKHSDKQYEQLMSPSRSPPKLKPMAPLPSSKNNKTSPEISNRNYGPYENGDPYYNHICNLCGMIYKRKSNWIKHTMLCIKLTPEARVSYQCVHCLKTFLVFKKFHYHTTQFHNRKEFICYKCHEHFKSPSEFLTHYDTHRKSENKRENKTISLSPRRISSQASLIDRQNHEENENINITRTNDQRFKCALCDEEFSSRSELAEHRNLHLKVKIYSCVICRSMFSSAGALEVHMKDHGIEDPLEQNANSSYMEYAKEDNDNSNTEQFENVTIKTDYDIRRNTCYICEKTFSNNASMRRHQKNVHNVLGHYQCTYCPQNFNNLELLDSHIAAEHEETKTPYLNCPHCTKIFVVKANLANHIQKMHASISGSYKCDICSKSFAEPTSLKIHRAWHYRPNSRLSIENFRKVEESLNSSEERPAKARKSFPNLPPANSSPNLLCQVCSDKFNDVTELRKHLWDVHCARNKPEKSFSGDELQCQLCTNVFPDQETLKIHLQWHKAHPILSDIRKTNYKCEVCGKEYSTRKILQRHKKLHKVAHSNALQSMAKKSVSNYTTCNVCQKTFSCRRSLLRHRASAHSDLQVHRADTGSSQQSSVNEVKTKKIKVEELEDGPSDPSHFKSGKKPVTCHVCKKQFPNMSILYRHKQSAHKNRSNLLSERVGSKASMTTLEFIPEPGTMGRVACNICRKQFLALSHLKQHFTIKHRKPEQAKRLSLTKPTKRLKYCPEFQPDTIIYNCNLCDRISMQKSLIVNHISNTHKTQYLPGVAKVLHRETTFQNYVIRGAADTICPRCNIKYPNNRSLKIHYFKHHANMDFGLTNTKKSVF